MASDWAKIRRNAKSGERAPGWPEGVKGISISGSALFGIDDNNRLYWDGHPIEIRRRLDLNAWEKTVTAITALAVIVGGFGQGIPAFCEFASRHWFATPTPHAAQPASAPQQNLMPGTKFDPTTNQQRF
jgi:hypothetical protein